MRFYLLFFLRKCKDFIDYLIQKRRGTGLSYCHFQGKNLTRSALKLKYDKKCVESIFVDNNDMWVQKPIIILQRKSTRSKKQEHALINKPRVSF